MYPELKPDETGNLHLMVEEMPCGPRQITIWEWMRLPSTLQRVEREEAAARLITFSRLFGAWVGVSWPRLVKMCEDEMELLQARDRVRYANRLERERVATANAERLGWRNTITCGWYARMYPEQVANQQSVPEVPNSLVQMTGIRFLVTGIKELRDNGMVRIETIDGNDVVFPTEQLVLRIMEVQKIVA